MTINELDGYNPKHGGIEGHRPIHEDAMQTYQRLATHTAIYPGQGTALGLVYVALKMNGEAGEFAEHVGKAMRDDGLMEHGVPDTARHLALVKEIGDVLWYLSAACNELGITLTEAAETNLLKLYDRKQRNTLQGSGDNR